MKRYLKCTLLLFLALFLGEWQPVAAISPPVTEAQFEEAIHDLQDYFPLQSGDNWTYSNGQEIKSFVVNGEEETFTEELALSVMEDGGEYTCYLWKENGLIFYRRADITGPYRADTPSLWIPRSLSLGESVALIIPITLYTTETGIVLRQYDLNRTVTLNNVEEITVPAGTFTNCLEIEISGDNNETMWLAEGVGRVKFLDDKGIEWSLITATVNGGHHPLGTRSETFPINNYFPLEQGKLWSYSRQGGGESTVVIDGTLTINGLETTVRKEPLQWFYETVDDSGYYIHSIFFASSNSFAKISPPEDPILFIPNPVSIGDYSDDSSTASLVGNLEEDSANMIDITFTSVLIGVEDVTVPYGTFKDCLKISYREINFLNFIGVFDNRSGTIWVAKDFGIVKHDYLQIINYPAFRESMLKIKEVNRYELGASISGTITGHQVSGVMLTWTNGTDEKNTQTDTEGNFFFGGVPLEDCLITPYYPGYLFIFPSIPLPKVFFQLTKGNISGLFFLSISYPDVFAPSINSIQPVSASGDDQITIKGNQFGLSAGVVILHPGIEAEIISWNPQEITCIVPRWAVTGDIYVINTLGTSNKMPIQILSEYPGNEMVFIDEVTFMMGSPEGYGHTDEYPLHQITLSPYYIDTFEVTNYQFAQFVEAGGYESKDYWLITEGNVLVTEGNCIVCHGDIDMSNYEYDPENPPRYDVTPEELPSDPEKGWSWKETNNIFHPLGWNLNDDPYWLNDPVSNQGNSPVTGISWYEAYAYAKWAGKRLPTEAEWEYAARGDDLRSYPWGNTEPDCSHANFKFQGIECAGKTSPVGSYEKGKSALNLYDMGGDLWEWLADWFAKGYYKHVQSEGITNNPRGVSTSHGRAYRGGGYNSYSFYLRSAYRTGEGDPGTQSTNIGFRCAKDAEGF